jgi:hypothetical protein
MGWVVRIKIDEIASPSERDDPERRPRRSIRVTDISWSTPPRLFISLPLISPTPDPHQHPKGTPKIHHLPTRIRHVAKRKGASPLSTLSISELGECSALRGAAFVIRVGQKFAHSCQDRRETCDVVEFSTFRTPKIGRQTPRIGPGVGVGLPIFPMNRRPRRPRWRLGLDGGDPAIGYVVSGLFQHPLTEQQQEE